MAFPLLRSTCALILVVIAACAHDAGAQDTAAKQPFLNGGAKGPVFTTQPGVTDSAYRAAQERMVQAGEQKKREALIQSARDGRLGRWEAIRVAMDTGDRPLQFYLLGKYLFYLAVVVVILWVILRQRR